MSTLQRFCLSFFVLGLIALCTTATAFAQATVTTDKADYSPGDTVLVTGSGWQPGESVQLVFVEDP
ncbi:MAG TPA: hypothetical protein VFF29_05350, partial [Bacteroidota bacterium]|nr:hypothetical protein [Bacteroidota bacterium]